MAPLYADGLVLCRTQLVHASGIKTAEVTYAIDGTVAPVTNALAVANAAQDAFADTLKGRIDSQVTIGPTLVLLGNGDSTPAAATSDIANTAGTLSIATPPPNNCALIQKHTGITGRQNRGRCYLPWAMDETTLPESGRLDATTRAQIAAAAEDWRARLESDEVPMCIAQRIYDAPWTDPNRRLVQTNIGPLVTSMTVDATLGSQRRRLR